MPSVIYDLEYITAGGESLETFLVTKSLFWPIHRSAPAGEPTFPRLTLGGLLLSIARLESRQLPFTESHQFDVLKMGLNNIRTSRSNAWERKAKREFQSRLRQWQQFLTEIMQNPETFIVHYESEVRIRVLLDLLGTDTRSCYDNVSDQVDQLDLLLRSVFQAGKFIWEDEISTGFNPTQFWYLWGKPVIEKFNII